MNDTLEHPGGGGNDNPFTPPEPNPESNPNTGPFDDADAQLPNHNATNNPTHNDATPTTHRRGRARRNALNNLWCATYNPPVDDRFSYGRMPASTI